MKQSTRVLLAAAVANVEGRRIAEVFDHTGGESHPMTSQALERMALERDGVIVYADAGERVSLKVREDLFSGWDHLTGAYFAGAIRDSEIMFYDGYDRRYYQFSVH